jgi:hypothetical protein
MKSLLWRFSYLQYLLFSPILYWWCYSHFKRSGKSCLCVCQVICYSCNIRIFSILPLTNKYSFIYLTRLQRYFHLLNRRVVLNHRSLDIDIPLDLKDWSYKSSAQSQVWSQTLLPYRWISMTQFYINRNNNNMPGELLKLCRD